MAPSPGNSIREVAREAGVSVGTVSNVLNRPHLVSASTLARVHEAIDALGFVRNESARQLRAGSSRAVGLVVIDSANPFFADVARGVEDTVLEHGGIVLTGNSAGDAEREARYLDLFKEQRVRGVLIAPTGEEPALLDSLSAMGIPVVFLDRFPDRALYSSVSVDDVVGGRMAAAHLLEKGHRQLAFVGGPSTLRQVRERREGLDLELGSFEQATLLTVSTPGLTFRAGREAADELATLDLDTRPTAVLAGNDLVALGLLQGFTAHGVRVPADIAIVGYDDIEFAAAAAVPLSSVRQPREELGRAGARLLYAAIEATEAGRPVDHQHVRFQPQLVVRRSSA